MDFGAGSSLTGPCAASWATPPLYMYWAPDRGQDATAAGSATGSAEPNGVWFRLGSKHTGILNMAFADGSVMPIANDINFNVWVYLGGRHDGQVVSHP